MRWEEVLARTDIVGGELETHEDGEVFRGPISKVLTGKGEIRFECRWMAKMDKKAGGGWKKWHIQHLQITADMSPPSDIGNGRISFNMPFLGLAVIFPKGGSKLDPTKVEGLTREEY